MIISRTPFRISFFGGGTDYPAWYTAHGGAFLSTTINRYCYVMCRRLPPFFDVRGRISWSMIENVSEWDEIKNPVVRETLRFLNTPPSFDIHYHGDLPARSGLGSSSAFTVGLLHAMHALRGEHVGKAQIAREAIKVEQDFIGDTVGVQDQIATAHGGLNMCTIEVDGSWSVRPVVLSRDRLTELRDHMMLFYTGQSRGASSIAASKVKNMAERTVELNRIRSLVDEGYGVLCGNGPIERFGELLHESWLMKRSLSSLVATDIADEAYRAARECGALGGKLLGAGGGGFMLIFAAPAAQLRIQEALKKLLLVPIELDRQGTQVIFHDSEQM